MITICAVFRCCPERNEKERLRRLDFCAVPGRKMNGKAKLNITTEVVDNQPSHSLHSRWKSRSSEHVELHFWSTWDPCSHWAHLETPASSFNRCAAHAFAVSAHSDWQTQISLAMKTKTKRTWQVSHLCGNFSAISRWFFLKLTDSEDQAIFIPFGPHQTLNISQTYMNR